MDHPNWKLHSSCKTEAECASFHDAIQIWMNKPQVVNRRLCGGVISFEKSSVQLNNAVEDCSVLLKGRKFTSENYTDLSDYLMDMMLPESVGDITLYIRDYLPKDLNHFQRVREVVLIGKVDHNTPIL
jgi:hypothetical protein